MDPATLSRHMKDLLPGLLGIEWLALDSERVRARFQVETRLCTMPGVLHGGAVMAFADTLGAVATVLNLEPGHTTTTIESKTNFLAAGRGGETIEGECTPSTAGDAPWCGRPGSPAASACWRSSPRPRLCSSPPGHRAR